MVFRPIVPSNDGVESLLFLLKRSRLVHHATYKSYALLPCCEGYNQNPSSLTRRYDIYGDGDGGGGGG
jgi:hypothetical protein